jgi:squalene-hopene/tetraprenyl-beta-curcumene cyclase
MSQIRLGSLLSLAAFLLLSNPFSISAASCTDPLVQEASIDDLDLKSEIDRSIRWLRSKQAPDGSYGGSVKNTAWVLQAFAMSPRKYTRRDGPFVSKALDYLAENQDKTSGGIFNAGANDLDRTVQSTLAWLALRQFHDSTSDAVRVKLEKYFNSTPKPSARKPLAPDEAKSELAKWMARRKADASWQGPDGSLIRTSEAIISLTRFRKVLSPPDSIYRSASILPKFSDADRKTTIDSLRRGALFLIAVSDDGLWGAPGKPELGTTAMALGAIQELPEPRPAEVQRVIDHGLDWLVAHQDKDGSIHDGKLKNYLTSSSILALAKSGDPKYAESIERARRFLVALQADEGEGYTDGDLYYGGIGYGGDERPDLSNLQMALEALSAAGTETGDESFTRALTFLERVQNRSESNDIEIRSDGAVIKSGNDGGAGYAPGESKAGFETLPDGTKVPRSYGSMTYALLKGFIFAGLPRDDPRMQAAWKWIQEHYTLDVNPGFEHSEDPTAPYQGLYYYFHTMARALDLYGAEEITDGSGKKHAWRQQVCGRVIAMQRKDDGSWVNENAPRWWEGNPVLATSYAMLTLGAAIPKD